MEKVNLQKLKEVELNIFEMFINVCKRLDLKYYLLGGTLLGAVRHGGFIPWDDDIDVGMPREDYEKLCAQGQRLLPDYYFIQTHHTDPEFPNNFLKIRDSRTTFLETSMKKLRINHGCFIDVFPLDYYPEKRFSQICFDIRRKFPTMRIRKELNIPKENRRGLVMETILTTLSRLTAAIYPTMQEAICAREKLYRSIPKCNYIANYSGAWGKKEIVPANWFGEGVELTFEGIKVRGPKEYHKWLTQVYGNYAKLPPIDKRVTHHYTEIIDLERPYTDYR